MNLKPLLVATALAVVAGHAASPVETYGPLSIKGNSLVDSSGAPVILRGMSLNEHNLPGGTEFWNASVMKTIMTDWHASVVRAPIAVDDNDTRLGCISDPSTGYYFARVAVEAAIGLGLYIIVDWHTEQMHPAEAKAFFGSLAKEYGNTPNIIWEIYNEPRGPGWPQISAYAKHVIPEIRKYSRNVILVGNSDWSMHPEEAGPELDGFSNIAYSVHFYPDETHWSRVAAAMAKGHAVFASQWALFNSSGGEFTGISGNIAQWIDEMNTRGVSYVNWSLGNPLSNSGQGPGSEPFAALNPGVSPLGNWKDAELTPSGRTIRNHLRSKNPAWTELDTTTKITSALAITSPKPTNLLLNQDSIAFQAGYSKSVSWTLTETGRTSGAKLTTTGNGVNVIATHLVGKRNLGSKAFASGETVDVRLEPKGQVLTYTISGATGSVRFLREVPLHWEGTRLVLPPDLLPKGEQVQVNLREASGKIIFRASAEVGPSGGVELSQVRPRAKGVSILEVVTGGDVYLRSRLSPKF